MSCEVAFSSGKQTTQKLASLAAVKPDLRRKTTAWAALVWAYADQSVRAATHCGTEPAFYCSNGLRLMRLGETGIGSGTINGMLEAHPDAWAIDNLVANWFDEWPEWRNGVAVYAEARKLPPRLHQLQRFQILGPQRTAKGNPIQLYRDFGAKDHPYLCPLEIEDGCTEADVERHRQFLALFEALLDVMAGLKLERWKIVGRGC
ncbi:MAG: hypothetical protein ABFD96_25090 [Armatimonadia bacterium]